MIQASIRRNETAARWGGEEFAVILPNTGIADAFSRAEALRNSFKHISSHRTPPLTISIGVSAAPDCGMTMQELVRSADAALYRAKATRDCTELADPVRQILVTSNGIHSDSVEIQ
jgi:diguanylate cyclase (GGDEF)-like protein